MKKRSPKRSQQRQLKRSPRKSNKKSSRKSNKKFRQNSSKNSNTKLNIAGGFNGTTFAQASAIDVAEVLIYDGAVPNAGLTTVWNYFKTKYGFTT